MEAYQQSFITGSLPPERYQLSTCPHAAIYMHTMIVDCPSIRGLMRNQMLTDKIQQASHHMPMPCMRLFALTPARGGILLAFLEPWASLNASLAALFAPWPRAQATSPPRHPTRIKNTESEDWPGGRGRHQAGSSWCAPCARLPISNRIPHYCCSYMERTCHSAGPWSRRSHWRLDRQLRIVLSENLTF